MDALDCNDIIVELSAYPLPRLVQGKSQTFGIVSRRGNCSDYSRNNWMRSFLYHLLLSFGLKYCPIPYNTITLIKTCRERKNRYCIGKSWVVGIGEYEGGEIVVNGVSKSVKGKGCIFDLHKNIYKINEVIGEGYIVIYSNYDPKKLSHLPVWTLQEEGGSFVFYKGTKRMIARTPSKSAAPPQFKIEEKAVLITWE